MACVCCEEMVENSNGVKISHVSIYSMVETYKRRQKAPNVYCGMYDAPKGKRKGSIKECLQRGQVRRYGVERVSKKAIREYVAERTETVKARKKLLKTLERVENQTQKGIDMIVKRIKSEEQKPHQNADKMKELLDELQEEEMMQKKWTQNIIDLLNELNQ